VPAPTDKRPEMGLEEFQLLRDLIHDHCGILIRDDLKYVMERRLAPRLEALRLASFSAYHRYLRYDVNRRAELDAAIEALTTNETYFFREPHQLEAFSKEILPALHEKNQRLRRLRIWSAGCSSGEEPYTIAMLIEETGLFAGWDVEVYGTDISRRVLTTARRAEYGASSLRATTPDQLRRYFDEAGAKVRVKDALRGRVSFGHLNLLDSEMSQLVPRSDVIFCRNVLIYFDTEARRRVLKIFYEKLFEGGYLLLGHSESLITLSADFELVHLRHDLVYRRPTAAPPRTPA
jgi:chemotaxis protein methyltransferase CheR